MKKIIYLLILLFVGFSCKNNSSKDASELVESVSEKIIITSDSIAQGVKYVSEKIVDQVNPPKILDYSADNYGYTNFDISKYAESVNFIRFRHPDADSSRQFFYNMTLSRRYERGMSTGNFSTSVYLNDEGYLVGDVLSGLYYYDLHGNIVDTVVKNSVPYKFEEGYYGDTIMSVNASDLIGFQGGGQNTGSEVFYLYSDTAKINTTYWYDLKTKKITIERHFKEKERVFFPSVINDSLFFNVSLPFFSDDQVFLTIFDKRGDTLALFKDTSHEKVVIKGNYNAPESVFAYIFDQKLNIRGSYNDTVFVLDAPNRLVAKYIIDLGDKRVDPETGMQGDKRDKLLPHNWMETKEFILFRYTKNNDAPINRDNNLVEHFYTFYDKGQDRIFHLKNSEKYPELFFFENNISDGIPFYYSDLRYSNKRGVFYVFYNKDSLNKLLKDKSMSKVSQAQRAKVQELYNSLPEGELLLMEMRER